MTDDDVIARVAAWVRARPGNTVAGVDVAALLRRIDALTDELHARDVAEDVLDAFKDDVVGKRAAELDALRRQLADVTRERDAFLAMLADGGDCGDGVHGPWCREWRKMQAQLAATERVVEAARQYVHHDENPLTITDRWWNLRRALAALDAAKRGPGPACRECGGKKSVLDALDAVIPCPKCQP